jgi:4a-hydroxytetrahydrobiopterin dehydratase
MTTHTADLLLEKHCKACEGGVAKYTPAEAERQLQDLSGWSLSADGLKIRKQWKVKDFMAGVDFFNEVAQLAENEQHHPDLHLEDYRNVRIELWTHAIGGLSENDFILAAKIDHLPVELQR